MPNELRYLLRYFYMASRGRGATFGAWLPIPPSEIGAVERLLRISLLPWEINALMRLDDAWREVMMEKEDWHPGAEGNEDP